MSLETTAAHPGAAGPSALRGVTPQGSVLPERDGPERQSELRLLERWAPTVFAGRDTLEVAAGAGYWTRFIAPQTHSLLATDGEASALALARQRVCSAKVQFAVADALALPASLGQFDGAFSGFWLSQLPRTARQAFLASLHARLQPGAKVLLLDQRYVPGTSHPISDTDDDGNTYQTRRGADGSVHRVLRNFPSGDELLAMIAGLGAQAVLHQWKFFWALCYEVA